MRYLPLLLPLLAGLLGAAAPPVTFIPENPGFAQETRDYRAIWRVEGTRIAAELEKVTGLTFPAAPIGAVVSETRPMTSYDGRSIDLRASYPPFYKKAELIHELGHRLALIFPRRGGLDDHRLLYLFLYDALTDLYGQAFADRIVSIERRIGPNYDAAWTWALSMTREERQARLSALTAPSARPG